MKLTFIAYGTRGDVQPIIALGQKLKAHGHAVRIIASRNFADWIQRHGLEAIAARVDIQSEMDSPLGHEWVANGHNPLKQLQVMKRMLNQTGFATAVDAWEGCQGTDAIITGFTAETYAASIAEKLQVKLISFMLQPAFRATRSGAVAYNSPFHRYNTWLNYFIGKTIIEPASWYLLGGITNQLRTQVLGLPPQTRQQNAAAQKDRTTLLAYSPAVIPPPADWPPNIHTSGYIFLDESDHWQPPIDLVQFIESGPPPIAIGFGSMTGRDVESMTHLMLEAIQRSGQRAIILSGWAGLGHDQMPNNIFWIESVPHAWLFPRVAAVVHHGGSGTTAESLRAGVPTLIVPHIADQFLWAQRVETLGVGPKGIKRPDLTIDRLARAIQQAVSDRSMRERAQALGRQIRSENGLENAVQLIEQTLS